FGPANEWPDFFACCGLAATRTPESGRSDLLVHADEDGAQNQHRCRQLEDRLYGRSAWTSAPMRGWSRPGVVFERLLPGRAWRSEWCFKNPPLLLSLERRA